MLKLFRKSDKEQKEYRKSLDIEISKLDKVILEKRKELKYLEAPLAEKMNILTAKEQELEDLINEYGDKRLELRKREELINLKEKVLEEKENNYIKRTI